MLASSARRQVRSSTRRSSAVWACVSANMAITSSNWSEMRCKVSWPASVVTAILASRTTSFQSTHHSCNGRDCNRLLLFSIGQFVLATAVQPRLTPYYSARFHRAQERGTSLEIRVIAQIEHCQREPRVQFLRGTACIRSERNQSPLHPYPLNLAPYEGLLGVK
jgi:hypothetical protein